MADPVLLRLGQLGEGAVRPQWNEEWIVTEALVAARFEGDAALATSLEEHRHRGRKARERDLYEGEAATEPGRPVCCGHTSEQAQQFGIVGLIGGIAGRTKVVGRETSRTNSGITLQGIDLEAGIVGQNQNPRPLLLGREPVGQLNGLARGVTGEGIGVLDQFGRLGELFEATALAQTGEQGLEFGYFVPVPGGEYQSAHAGMEWNRHPADRGQVTLRVSEWLLEAEGQTPARIGRVFAAR